MIWLCEYLSRTLTLSTMFAVSSGMQLSPRRSSVTVFRSGRMQRSPAITAMLPNTYTFALEIILSRRDEEQRSLHKLSYNFNSPFMYLDMGNTRTNITIKYSSNTVANTVAIFGSI